MSNRVLEAIGNAMDDAIAELNATDVSTNRELSVWYSYNDGTWKWAWLT